MAKIFWNPRKELICPEMITLHWQAVKYGQLEIFKILLQHSQGKTKGLKRTFFLWFAKIFQIEIYDHNLQYAVKAEGEDGKKCKQDMLEFIESLI